jgi:hypothetical protein
MHTQWLPLYLGMAESKVTYCYPKEKLNVVVVIEAEIYEL